MLLLWPGDNMKHLNPACVLTFTGVWIEKGMGLIVAGFIPSTLHEIVGYLPTLTEWRVTAGIWVFGALVLTAGLKVVLTVMEGDFESHDHKEKAPET